MAKLELENNTLGHLKEDLSLFAPAFVTPTLTEDSSVRLRRKKYWDEPSTPDNFPVFLVPAFNKQMEHFDRVLTKWQQKLPPIEEEMDERQIRYKTRAIALDLFPQLKPLIKAGKENSLLNRRKLEDFINLESIPMAKLFSDWLIAKLPEKYHQTLENLRDVDEAKTLIDLVRLYGGKSATAAIISQEPSGELFNRQISKEVNIMLGLVYLVTLDKMIKWPNEEKLLEEFSDQVSSIFKDLEQHELYMQFAPMEEGDPPKRVLNCVLARLEKIGPCTDSVPHVNYVVQEREQTENERLTKTLLLTVRRFGNLDRQVAMIENREKEPWSIYFKMLRNRPYPLTDTIAARFVVGDIMHAANYVTILFKRLNEDIEEKERKYLEKTGQSIKLPRWYYERDPGDTISQQSVLDYAIKYHAWKDDYPEVKIEIQVDGITNHDGTTGAMIEKRFESDSNDEAYKMRQLIETILPIIRPYDLYGVNWQDPDIREELLNYANAKALGLSVSEYLRYLYPVEKQTILDRILGKRKRGK